MVVTENYKLDGLTEQEKQEVLKILQQMSTQGQSDRYNQLLYLDYEEIPVTITEFIHNTIYLGNGLNDPETGRTTVFPYWENTLKQIFPTNVDTAYNTLVLSGAIGLGKSLIAVVCLLYMLYRMMCLKDPYTHFGLQQIDKITFSFINITMEAAKGVGWNKCQELLQSSSWFMSRGTLSKGLTPEWQPPKGIELIYGSLPRHVIGRAVFCSFEDEVSFQPNQDIDKQKQKAKELISSIDARMQSRFMKGEKLPTLHILASSKRTEQSFLETYIDMKKRNESKTTLVIDEPQWVIRTDKDSPNKFCVAVGNKFLNSEILPLGISESDLAVYRDRGFSILKVPMGYYENFLDDIDIALTDIAGISTSNATKYISGARWAAIKKEGLHNPFTKEILKVGNDPADKAQYYDFFDLTQIDPELKSRPLYIHLDMSLSGDKTGIAGIWIKGKKPHQEGVPDSKELYYRLAFSVSIEAPKGHQVSFEKNRQFIYWLREQGFNIKKITCDTFQSADLMQSLVAHGYKSEVLSVDRVNQDRICLPYQYFKSTIYEERLEVYPTTLLTEEVVGLERNNNGKIDHPMGGTIGSKDQVDAVCGAIYTASQDAEQFAFDYGETLDLITTVSGGQDNRNQLIVDFENEMKQALNPVKTQQVPFKDFGLGKAQPLRGNYLADGIILW